MPASRAVFLKGFSGPLIPFAGALLITVFTFPALDFQTFSGLDPAYFYALNYFFKEGLVAGRDYIFSYGPMGFLKDPQALSGLAATGVAVVALLRFLAAWILLNLARKARFSIGLAVPVVFLALARLQGLDYVVFLLGASLALLYRVQTKPFFFFSAWSTAAFGALIKMNIGFTTAVFLLVFFALDRNIKHRLKTIVSGLGIFSFVYLLFWLIACRTIEGSGLYLWYSLKLAPDNLAATVLPTTTDTGALIASALLFTTGCLWLYVKRRSPFGPAAWIAFFLVFRYSVARSDFFHLVHGFNIMVAAAALMLLSHAPRPVPVALWGLALLLWRTACHGLDYVPDPIRLLQLQLSGFRQSLWNHHATVREALEKNVLNLEKDSLPAPWLRQIGQEAVDFFPWVTSAVARYGLNYRPRPFMQHGLGADPLFDEITARYLRSEKAAPFMIWHGGWDSTGMQTMDGRYLGAEHTLTLRDLLCCYEVVDARSQTGILLRRKAEARSTKTFEKRLQPAPTREILLRWNKWISIPAEYNAHVWGKISGNVNLVALVRRWLWKEAVYYLDFQDTTGRTYTHRLALEGARDRMLLSPYYPTFPFFDKALRIRSVRFRVTEGLAFFRESFLLTLWSEPLCASRRSD